MIRDAIANAIQERWPETKITDVVDGVYGDPHVTTSNRASRINVELPYEIHDIAMRIATIDINGEKISATFYGGSEYSNNLFHPKSLTELEDLLDFHIRDVKGRLRQNGL